MVLTSTKGEAEKHPPYTKQLMEMLQGHGAVSEVLLHHCSSLLSLLASARSPSHSPAKEHHSGLALSSTIKLIWLKGKNTREKKEKPQDESINHDAVHSKDWLAAGSGLTVTLGWEKAEVGGIPNLQSCQSLCFCRQSAGLIIPNY